MSIALNEPLLTVRETAELLKVHPETVREWLRDGALVGVKPGGGGRWRVPKAELERFTTLPTSPLPHREARRG